MLKKLLIGLGILSLLAGPVQAAGSISLSLSQQFDSLGRPLNGGLLYTYAAGTTTPQSAYQDSGLTLPWPNPITLDSAGRVPQLFFADGSIKIRLTNAAGVVQLAADGILVIGASSGGGGGSPVDATTILATGDFKARYGTGSLTGFVRCNGRTIGSATSGASERANADAQDLFEYFWNADSNLSVSTGRGATANADWVANKALTLPDCRGRTLANLDDMGNSSADRLNATIANNTTLGSSGGAQTVTLTTTNLPPYTPSGTNSGGAASYTFSSASFQSGVNIVQGTNISAGGGTAAQFTNPTFTGTPQGGNSTPFSTVQPSILITTYIKL